MRLSHPLLLLLRLSWSATLHARTALTVETGVEPDGRPSPVWLSAVRVFNDEVALEALARVRKPWSENESAWARLIGNRSANWTDRQGELQMPFGAVEAPDTVTIVLGNQAATTPSFPATTSSVSISAGYWPFTGPHPGLSMGPFEQKWGALTLRSGWLAKRRMETQRFVTG